MRLFSALRSRLHNPKCTGPIKRHMNNAKETIKDLDGAKQWFCGGYRSAAIAAQLLLDGKVIAIPTDTIYGLAGLAQNNKSIKRLYEIKKRDGSKPLAIWYEKHMIKIFQNFKTDFIMINFSTCQQPLVC